MRCIHNKYYWHCMVQLRNPQGAHAHQDTPTEVILCTCTRPRWERESVLRGISVAGSIVRGCIADCRLAAGVRAVGKPLNSLNKAAQIANHKSPGRHRAEEWEQGDKGTGVGVKGRNLVVAPLAFCVCEVFSVPDWMCCVWTPYWDRLRSKDIRFSEDTADWRQRVLDLPQCHVHCPAE